MKPLRTVHLFQDFYTNIQNQSTQTFIRTVEIGTLPLNPVRAAILSGIGGKLELHYATT